MTAEIWWCIRAPDLVNMTMAHDRGDQLTGSTWP
jgi:hypothetical protein